MQERLDRVPLMAIMEALTNTPPTTILNPFYDTYLKPELNSLKLWDHSGDLMLAQVVYIPDQHMQYLCHLYLHKEASLLCPVKDYHQEDTEEYDHRLYRVNHWQLPNSAW